MFKPIITTLYNYLHIPNGGRPNGLSRTTYGKGEFVAQVILELEISQVMARHFCLLAPSPHLQHLTSLSLLPIPNDNALAAGWKARAQMGWGQRCRGTTTMCWWERRMPACHAENRKECWWKGGGHIYLTSWLRFSSNYPERGAACGRGEAVHHTAAKDYCRDWTTVQLARAVGQHIFPIN